MLIPCDIPFRCPVRPRNFGYKWGLSGVERDPCQRTYLGAAPFVAKEAAAIREPTIDC